MTGDLHSELAGASAPACKLCAFIANQPAAVADEWQAELARPVTVIGNTAVVNALRRRGLTVAESAVRRHRRNHVNA